MTRAGLVVLTLAVVAAVVTALVLGQDDAAPTAARSTPAPATSATAGTATPSTSAPASSTPTPSTSAPRPSPTPTGSSTRDGGGAPTAAELRDGLVGYYALLPEDRDAGWDRLTSRYQRTTARNRDYYESFWGAIDKVSVAALSASEPDTVTATVTYDYDDGRVYVERTRYRLVEDDGILKVDRSEVLSSVRR